MSGWKSRNLTQTFPRHVYYSWQACASVLEGILSTPQCWTPIRSSHSGSDSGAIWRSVSALQLVLLPLHGVGAVSAKQLDSHTFCSTILLLMRSTCISASPWGFICFFHKCITVRFQSVLQNISYIPIEVNAQMHEQAYNWYNSEENLHRWACSSSSQYTGPDRSQARVSTGQACSGQVTWSVSIKNKKKQPNTTCMYYITMNIRVWDMNQLFLLLKTSFKRDVTLRVTLLFKITDNNPKCNKITAHSREWQGFI